MKEVVKLIEKHVNERKIDRHQGLNVLLDFMVDLFDISHFEKINGFLDNCKIQAKKEPYLYQVTLIWLGKVSQAIEEGSWIDFFGGIYEEMYQSKGKASTLGQFFTPPNLCYAIAKVSQPIEGKISDCACGSGRTLLAGASAAGFPRSNFYIGEDLDVVSVKMCALNLMIHGCKGRVVQHDSLKNPILYDYGFRINDIRYPIPTPFYSLTRISLTKEDIASQNERIKEMYGDNVKVEQYNGYEVVKPNGKPKPLFENKETECVQSYTQLSLF